MDKFSATIPLQYDTGFSPFLAAEFDEALPWLVENGFRGIELCIAEPKKVNTERLNNQLARYGLAVSAISINQVATAAGISLSDSSETIRHQAVVRLKEHIELAAAIGFPLVNIGLLRGFGTPGQKELELALLAESLEECVAYAAQCQVELLLEPMNRYETTLLNTVDETLTFLANMAGGAQIGVLFNTFHANIEEPNICRSLERLGERLLHVHFADSNRCLPGMGHIDFGQIAATLYKMNYSGYISLETINMPTRQTVRARSQRSLQQCFVGIGP